MPKYRKKPVEIEAIQWIFGFSLIHDVLLCFGGLEGMKASSILKTRGNLLIKTDNREITVYDGDWIIRSENGLLYPCAPDIFELTYERLEDNA